MNTKTKTNTNIELIAQVQHDFESRRLARRAFELQWQLNIDYVRGNQNNYISKFGDIITAGRQFYWQEREIFNHIGPMIESRLGKLSEVSPTVAVTPSTAEQRDIDNAVLGKKIIASAFQRINMHTKSQVANMWSELTGTAFYKVIWNNKRGKVIGEVNGKAVNEGDIDIVVCSPFEVYPDSLTASDIGECRSIIHAKAYKTTDIMEIWGTGVKGSDIDVFDLCTPAASIKNPRNIISDSAIVIERYEAPSKQNPRGRLTIVAGDKLLHNSELPYQNGADDTPSFPFVRQCSEQTAGCFYGHSVVERAIPVQRAYNSVKNRKAEFLNRLSCGVLSVEDGSTDLESLEQDGLAPGKILVHRAGTTAPKFMDTGTLPAELEREEERLLREFATISGSSDLLRSPNQANLSGIALQILVEQDNKRMSRTVGSILQSHAIVAQHILRLYRQYSTGGRLHRLTNERDIEMFFWNSDTITSDEVTATNASDIGGTPSARRMIILELLNAGLLSNKDGEISERARAKILHNIGFEDFI
jgi:hypothetical protein